MPLARSDETPGEVQLATSVPPPREHVRWQLPLIYRDLSGLVIDPVVSLTGQPDGITNSI